jgi:hypothetical protein
MLIGFGERAIGTIAELPLSSSSAAIISGHGYQGIIDTRARKLYDFQRGSVNSHESFAGFYQRVAKDLGLQWEAVENTMSCGEGDDSAVIKLLKDYNVPDVAQDVIDGRHRPEAGIVKLGQTESEHDAAKFAGYFTGVAGALTQGLNMMVNGPLRAVPNSNDRIIKPTDWDEIDEVRAIVPDGDMKNFARYRNQLNHQQPTCLPR